MKYRIIQENDIYRVEFKKFFSWKPVTIKVYKEDVDLIFSSFFLLQEYIQEIISDHLSENKPFSIVFSPSKEK